MLGPVVSTAITYAVTAIRQIFSGTSLLRAVLAELRAAP
jgi:hypothetical protein